MPLLYTNYKFTQNLLFTMDKKYTKDMDLDHSKILLYANTKDIISLYQLYHPFQKMNYTIETDFFNNPYQFLTNSINYIIKNKYYKKDILLVYSIISNYCLEKNYSKAFENQDVNKKLLDYTFGIKNDVDLSKMNLYKTYGRNFIYSFTELDYYKTLCNELYHFPMADSFFKLCVQKFKNIEKKNLLNSLYFTLMDFFFFRKKNIHHKDFLYPRKLSKIKVDSNILEQFDQVLKDSTLEAKKILEAFNQALYYKNFKPLNLLYLTK